MGGPGTDRMWRNVTFAVSLLGAGVYVARRFGADAKAAMILVGLLIGVTVVVVSYRRRRSQAAALVASGAARWAGASTVIDGALNLDGTGVDDLHPGPQGMLRLTDAGLVWKPDSTTRAHGFRRTDWPVDAVRSATWTRRRDPVGVAFHALTIDAPRGQVTFAVFGETAPLPEVAAQLR